MNREKFQRELETLALNAEELDRFLARTAPEWRGVWAQFALKARALATASGPDLVALESDLVSPYRGTFGSMTDLSFNSPEDAQFKSLSDSMFEAFDAAKNARFESEPNVGRIRRVLVELEGRLIERGDSNASALRTLLDAPSLDLDAIKKLIPFLAENGSPEDLMILSEELARNDSAP